MAERRMFSKKIVTSDAFIEMSTDAKALYFCLGIEADDDGFVGNPKAICRFNNLNKDALQELIKKRFILTFPSEVIVVKHFQINNLIRQDRHKTTSYIKELATLKLDDNGSYTELKKKCNDNQVTTKCPHRIGKDSIGKSNNKLDDIPITIGNSNKADEPEVFEEASVQKVFLTLTDGQKWEVPDKMVVSFQKMYPKLSAYETFVGIACASEQHRSKRPYPQNIYNWCKKWFDNEMKDSSPVGKDYSSLDQKELEKEREQFGDTFDED